MTTKSRLPSLKSFLWAVVILLLLVVGVEVSFRVYDSYTGQYATANPTEDSLTTHSWSMHHEMQPLFKSEQQGHASSASTISLTTNSLGLRGLEPVIPKPAGIYRVVVLGDEQVLAPHIEESHTFCYQLEELLSKQTTEVRVEVINAGVPRFCPLLSYLQMRRLASLQPDLVILTIEMGDVADDYRYRRYTRMDSTDVPIACPHPALKKSDTVESISGWDRVLTVRAIKQRMGKKLLKSAKPSADGGIDAPAARYAWLQDNPPDWSVHIEHMLSPVNHLQRLCRGIYAQLVVAVVPAPWQISEDATAPEVRAQYGIAANALYRNPEPWRIFDEFTRPRRIPLCAPYHTFSKAPQASQLYLRDFPELSEAGHTLFARELAMCILRNVPGVWRRQ